MIPRLNKRLSELTFVAFDVETTGLEPLTDRIVEIGAARFDSRSIRDTYEQLVNPGCTIPRSATAIHGITNSDVASSPQMRDVLSSAIEFFGDSVLVAHNAQFDAGFFGAAYAETDLEPLPSPIVCTRELARTAFPGLPNYRLTTLVKELHIPADSHHRALADAAHCAAVFSQCVDRIAPAWGLTLGDLLGYHGPPVAFSMAPTGVLEIATAAAERGSSIRIEYRDGRGKVTVRDITPLSIDKRTANIKIAAFCHLRGQKRTFRLDCIRKIL